MAEDNQTNNQNSLNSDITFEKLQTDLDQAINGWRRTQADFENFKKQKEKESKDLIEFAKEVTVVKLLPTLDALEQALRHMPTFPADVVRPFMGKKEQHEADKSADYKADENNFAKAYHNWQIGVQGIAVQLDKVLGELGIKKIEAVGKKFDPHFHEAVREIESESDDGIILEELQAGFELNGKVIRPTQAIISKKILN